MNIVSIVSIIRGRVTVGNEVTIRGWVRTRRDSKIGISFLTIYDGSCLQSLQVITNSSLSNYKKDILRLTAGCSVSITGKIVISPSKGQTFELQAYLVEVIGWVDNPEIYPISAKYHSVEYLREMAHLRPRTNLISAVAHIRHKLANALHCFFNEQGYLWISTPLITSFDTEGASKMFRVSTLDMENLPLTTEGKIDYNKDFFGKKSYLTVSGQLNGESYACALSKIYTFGPTFRAENSNTSRHLSEFWMLEPEVAFANLNDITSLAEDMLKYVFKVILKECADIMKFLAERINNNVINRLEQIISNNFIQVDYTDAISILETSDFKFKYPVYWGIDLTSEHERYLTEKYFKAPIIIKNYPKNVKAFYMRLNDDNKTVAAMDIIMPEIGEIIGGSQREERLEVLDARMEEIGINKKDYWWYRDLRRYGTVPHSGFGLGFERLINYVTGIHNIRDVIPFPRTSRNLAF